MESGQLAGFCVGIAVHGLRWWAVQPSALLASTLVLAAGLLAGCASGDERYDAGYSDGHAAGYNNEVLGTAGSATTCAKHQCRRTTVNGRSAAPSDAGQPRLAGQVRFPHMAPGERCGRSSNRPHSLRRRCRWRGSGYCRGRGGAATR
jgi:hypothetical protein